MLVARFVLVLSSSLLLANCAGQDLATYALADRNAAQDFTPNEPQFEKTQAQLAARPHLAKKQVPEPTAPVQSADLTSSVAPLQASVEPPRPSVEPVRSSIAPLPVSRAPLSYVEQLAKDDKEDQYLAQKTKICRGC